MRQIYESVWVPCFRHLQASNQNELYKMARIRISIFTEPISKIAPKMTSGDDLKRLKVPENGQIALLCPAQSYPVGAFR